VGWELHRLHRDNWEENKITEQEEKLIERARKLKETLHTRGWEVIVAYVFQRGAGLKNQLAGIDLTKDLSKAMQTQGEIKGINSVINWVVNTINEAKPIEEREIKKREKKK